MQYEVLKPFVSGIGKPKPGDKIAADQFHNTDALVNQRYILIGLNS